MQRCTNSAMCWNHVYAGATSFSGARCQMGGGPEYPHVVRELDKLNQGKHLLDQRHHQPRPRFCSARPVWPVCANSGGNMSKIIRPE
eukprot:1184326-Prorocentrum_minimum.AAC.2